MCMDIHPNPGTSTSETHTLDIFHLYTRSVRNKLDHLSDINDSYHVLCFSETHLDAVLILGTCLLKVSTNPYGTIEPNMVAES